MYQNSYDFNIYKVSFYRFSIFSDFLSVQKLVRVQEIFSHYQQTKTFLLRALTLNSEIEDKGNEMIWVKRTKRNFNSICNVQLLKKTETIIS